MHGPELGPAGEGEPAAPRPTYDSSPSGCGRLHVVLTHPCVHLTYFLLITSGMGTNLCEKCHKQFHLSTDFIHQIRKGQRAALEESIFKSILFDCHLCPCPVLPTPPPILWLKRTQFPRGHPFLTLKGGLSL